MLQRFRLVEKLAELTDRTSAYRQVAKSDVHLPDLPSDKGNCEQRNTYGSGDKTTRSNKSLPLENCTGPKL
jgi:hypothetical protein